MSGWGILEYVLAVLGVSALIAWHELGHYMAARLLGMRVLKYSVGFGPKLWSFERGGIEYQIAAIPFGGFVQVFGMAGIEEGAYSEPDSYQMKPRWARWLVLFAGPAFNYILAAALFFGMYLVWPGGNVRVQSVLPDRPAAAAGILPGDEILKVNDTQLDSLDHFVDFIQLGEPLTFDIQRNDLVQRWFELKSDLRTMRKSMLAAPTDVGLDDKSTQLLKTGEVDAVVKLWQGSPSTDVDVQMQRRQLRLKHDELKRHEQRMGVEKGTTQTLKVKLTPTRNGRFERYMTGVVPTFEDDEKRSSDVARAAANAIVLCWSKSIEQARGLASLFIKKDPSVKLSGPIGIAKTLATQVRESKKTFIYILGLLSVTLAVFNIIPIPALDGFKMMWLTVEMVMRGEVLPRVQMWLNVIGFLLLMGTLFVVTIMNDL